MLHKQTKNCEFMTGSQHFSPDDSQFQLVYDRGQCAELITLILLPTAFYDFLSYRGGGVDFLSPPQRTMLNYLFDLKFGTHN